MKLRNRKDASYRILKRESIFRGRAVQLDILKILTKSGRKVERELIKHPGAVVVIGVTPNGKLIFVKQLRVAAEKWILEFPAGTLEKGETPRACAQRELQEETGWRAGSLKKILEFFPTPGTSNEVMHLYVAGRLEKASGLEMDEDEELEVHYYPMRQVTHLIKQGKILDGKTILGFLFWQSFCRRSSVGRATVS